MTGNKAIKPTLDRPTKYTIKVAGEFDNSWFEWDREVRLKVEYDDEEKPLTTLTCRVDQAGLMGLLRRLYSIGIPLISVDCSEFE